MGSGPRISLRTHSGNETGCAAVQDIKAGSTPACAEQALHTEAALAVHPAPLVSGSRPAPTPQEEIPPAVHFSFQITHGATAPTTCELFDILERTVNNMKNQQNLGDL